MHNIIGVILGAIIAFFIFLAYNGGLPW